MAGDVHTVDNTHPWLDGLGWPQDSDRNVVKLGQNQTTPKMVWEKEKMVWERRKDGERERKIEPKPVSNTHPNPVTSTPLDGMGWLDGSREMKKRRKLWRVGHREIKQTTTLICVKHAGFSILTH